MALKGYYPPSGIDVIYVVLPKISISFTDPGTAMPYSPGNGMAYYIELAGRSSPMQPKYIQANIKKELKP
jgi:hypothetical protein